MPDTATEALVEDGPLPRDELPTTPDGLTRQHQNIHICDPDSSSRGKGYGVMHTRAVYYIPDFHTPVEVVVAWMQANEGAVERALESDGGIRHLHSLFSNHDDTLGEASRAVLRECYPEMWRSAYANHNEGYDADDEDAKFVPGGDPLKKLRAEAEDGGGEANAG